MHFDAFIYPFLMFVALGVLIPIIAASSADASRTKGGAAPAAKSLYDRLGGSAAVNAAVDVFYRRVLADAYVVPFFEGVDMDKQAGKQKAFLTMVFGGPNNYTGLDMRKGHRHLVQKGLDDTHFDHILAHLRSTLAELGVGDATINEVIALAETTRNDVLDR